MKKALALILALVMVLSLAACGTQAETPATEPTEAPAEAPAEQPAESETPKDYSGYTIRKAHLPGQLSSFEAAAQALAQLHNWSAGGDANATLHEVFRQFVAQQLQLRQRNQAPQRSA